MQDEKTLFRRYAPTFAGVVLVSVMATVAVGFIRDMLSHSTPPKKSVQQITLLQPPPPPPKVEPQPEPEIEEVKLSEPEPEPVPDDSNEPAPGEDLAVDAEGGAGGDGFGLLGKKGGRSLIGSGSGFGWFASQVQSDVQEILNNREDIRKKRYAVKVNLWVDEDGSVRNIEMIGSSGNAEMDRSLNQALKQITQLKTRPPEALPQPIRLRIASRM